ncbi:putative damage-inducible protein DinB [Variovorax boronicumulans]|nr:putative damage-inducible protein DinB [Variovorax boronicumulans]MDQ0003331.1 putative damage-inducible protein DinB [Variovorax boronicumulans]
MASILGHVHVVDLIWKAHLEGRPHGSTSRAVEKTMGLEASRDAQAEVDRWYVDCADGLSDDAHDEVVDFRFVDGGTGAMPKATWCCTWSTTRSITADTSPICCIRWVRGRP